MAGIHGIAAGHTSVWSHARVGAMRHVSFGLVLGGLAVLSACGVATGQSQSRVVPAAAANAGNARSFPPFVTEAGRLQVVVDRNELRARSAFISAIAFRKDSAAAAYRGRTLSLVKVGLGHAFRPAGRMSTKFRRNRSGPVQVLFAGSLALPDQKAGVAPWWNVVLPLRNPFLWGSRAGDLLLEIEMPGHAQRVFGYAVDAYVQGRAGSHGVFGARGPFARGDRYSAFTQLDQLRPGGELILHSVGLTRPYPTHAILGVSRTRFGSTPLPLDLAPFGAPKNFLHVSIDAVVPAPIERVDTSHYRARALVEIPADPSLAGRTIYAQNVSLDPASNALGAVFSNGMRATLGSGPTAPIQALFATNSITQYGGFVFPGRTGGPVLRIVGVFR